MIDITVFVVLVGLLVVAAHFFSWFSSFTAIPDALLLMMVGLLLGPILGVIPVDFFGEVGTVVLVIALVIMLFEAGISFHVRALQGMFGSMMRLMVTSFVLATIGVAGLLYYLAGVPFIVALMAGAIVGDATPSVVLALMKRLAISEEAESMLVLESTFSDVLVVAFTLTLLQAYRSGSLELSQMAWSIVLSVGVALVMGVVFGLAWAHVLDKVRHLQNSMFITAAMAFIVYGVMEALEFSGLIAVLSFGITMGSSGALNHYLATRHRLVGSFVHPSSLSKREKAFFSELVFLLKTFFFIYLGLSISFTDFKAQWMALLAVGLLLVLRFIAVRTSVPERFAPREVSAMAVMVPKGLTSVVLVLLLVQTGVPGAEFLQNFVYKVILWSIIATSLMVFLLEKTPLSKLYARFFTGYGTEPLPGIRKSL